MQQQQQQQHQSERIPHTYITYENINKQNRSDEILIKERRAEQQQHWENQLKGSYQWREAQIRKSRWLRRRAREKDDESENEMLWDDLERLEAREEEEKQRKEQWEQEQLRLFLAVDKYEEEYREHLKQINYVEQMDEEERNRTQEISFQQLEQLQQHAEDEHVAQLKYIEWYERSQQQPLIEVKFL